MSPVVVCLVLLFGPSLSVVAQSAETIGAGPANQGCTTTSNNPCFASIFDGTTSQGFADIYLVRKADGSFTNGTILRYINDTFQWAANNFTGGNRRVYITTYRVDSGTFTENITPAPAP